MSRILFIFLMIWIFSTNAIASVVSVCPHMNTSVVMDQSDVDGVGHSAHKQHTTDMAQADLLTTASCIQDACDTSSHDCSNCMQHCSTTVLISLLSFTPKYTGYAYEAHLSYFTPSATTQRLLRPPRLI